jgi:hypothetical protein
LHPTPLTGRVVEVHAGATYVEAMQRPWQPRHTGRPAPGIDHGRAPRLVRLTSDVPADSATVNRSDLGAALFVQRLRCEAAALTPTESLDAQGAGLRVPGLYSWWVDAAGAASLSRGLGLAVHMGLVYAGLARATRWPSGKPSTNTLWSRIAGMHLGGNHEFSTFRRALGAVLANATDNDGIDETALIA